MNIVTDLPAYQYHAMRDHLSGSLLKEMDKSPSHYRTALEGKTVYSPQTLQAMECGTQVHLRIESAELFRQKYVMKPEGYDGRKAESKAFVNELKESGRKMIERDDYLRIEAMVESFNTNDDDLLRMVRESEGNDECSVLWEEQGLKHRCRPDRLIRPNEADSEMLHRRFPALFDVPFGITICVDYKTIGRYPEPRTWYYHSRDLRYPLVASHYLAGTKADAFLWVVLEKSPPYTVTRYLMKPDTRQINDERRRVLIEQIKTCQAENEWPGLTITDEETLL